MISKTDMPPTTDFNCPSTSIRVPGEFHLEQIFKANLLFGEISQESGKKGKEDFLISLRVLQFPSSKSYKILMKVFSLMSTLA